MVDRYARIDKVPFFSTLTSSNFWNRGLALGSGPMIRGFGLVPSYGGSVWFQVTGVWFQVMGVWFGQREVPVRPLAAQESISAGGLAFFRNSHRTPKAKSIQLGEPGTDHYSKGRDSDIWWPVG